MFSTTTDPSSSSILSLPSHLLNAPVRIAGNYGWAPLVSLARSSVTSLFSRLNTGLLTIRDADGTTYLFGNEALIAEALSAEETSASISLSSPSAAAVPSSSFSSSSSSSSHSSLSDSEAAQPLKALLVVTDDTFWVRMLFGADLGFSEAFMAGEVETPDLGDCFSIFIQNRSALSELDLGVASRVTGWIQGQLNKRYANTKGGSLKNIGAHYDISNAMYERFLSKDMTYSCGIFPTLDADVAPPVPLAAANSLRCSGPNAGGRISSKSLRQLPRDSGLGSPQSDASHPIDELEEAQMIKLRLHISRCQISPGDRVLEIGTGWGSLAMETCNLIPGVTVDSLTLSKEQKSLAEARIREAGLEQRIRVHLMDYRDMPKEWAGSFDRVVSIEMLEAVGIEFLSTYFSAIHQVLKADSGTAVFQCITMPEARFESYVEGVDFIKKYIFPGGVLPSVTSLVNAMTDGSRGTMILQAVDSIGPHYARTLREWRRRFQSSFEGPDGIREALLKDHATIRNLPKDKQDKEVEVFKRKWLYYFIYCERGFSENQIGDHILTFARVGATKQPVSFGP